MFGGTFMKLKFNLKKKEASLEADAERLIEKKMDYDQKNLENNIAKKTRYQIRQEEKRKNKELEFNQKMKIIKVAGISFAIIIAIIMVMAIIEKVYNISL